MADAAAEKQLQEDLVEFQSLQRQLQVTMLQKQQYAVQLEELKLAGEELTRASGSIYRAIGTVIVQTSKEDAKKDVEEKSEAFGMRLGALAKQEEKLRKRLFELRDRLEAAAKLEEGVAGG